LPITTCGEDIGGIRGTRPIRERIAGAKEITVCTGTTGAWVVADVGGRITDPGRCAGHARPTVVFAGIGRGVARLAVSTQVGIDTAEFRRVANPWPTLTRPWRIADLRCALWPDGGVTGTDEVFADAADLEHADFVAGATVAQSRGAGVADAPRVGVNIDDFAGMGRGVAHLPLADSGSATVGVGATRRRVDTGGTTEFLSSWTNARTIQTDTD
jgi:hypothetical protein